MIKVEVKSVNASHVRIVCDRGVLQEIVEYFSFFAPAYQFHPKFKARIWDGKIRLVSPRDSLLYVGLIDKLREFCEDSEYEFVDNSGYSNSKEDVPENIAEIIAKDVNLDPKYKVRDYQAQYIYNAIRDSRSINLSPTSSGKSLIIYLIMSYYRMKYQSRTLIVVPTVGLVKQMANDFLDYGCDPSIIHGISAGASKKTSHPIVVSTWQSLARIKEKSWFEQFDVILGDEVHTFAAKSLQDIMNSLTECYWRHGFTGTIGEDSKCVSKDSIIQTKYGPRKICDLSIGDEVYSFNANEDAIELKKIVRVINNGKPKERMLKIETEKGSFICTESHKVYTENRGWISAGDLNERDLLMEFAE